MGPQLDEHDLGQGADHEEGPGGQGHDPDPAVRASTL